MPLSKEKKNEVFYHGQIYSILASLQMSFYLTSTPYYLEPRGDRGYLWEPGTSLKYSFTADENTLFSIANKTLDNFNFAISNVRVLSDESQKIARECFAWWQETCNLFFIEEKSNPDFYVLNTKVESDFPFFGYSQIGKNLFLTEASNAINIDEDLISNYSIHDPFLLQSTLFHEIGHGGIGLLHPFDNPYNKYELDSSTYYSIMNYENVMINNVTYVPISPMPYDIDKAQFLYGKKHSTHSGNTLYHLENYTLPVPSKFKTIASLPWDASGTDTLSAKGLSSDVTLDLRRYGQSSLPTGNVWTPNIFVENVISGCGKNTIYLNEMDNVAEITDSNQTDLHVEPYFNGNDVIIGFKPERDRFFLHYDASVHPLPSYTLKTKLHTCQEKAICFDTTIQFQNNHSLTLLDVDANEIKITPVAREKPDQNQINSFAIDSLEQSWQNYLSALPVQLGEDFINAFLIGGALTFISELNDEVLKYYHCTDMQRKTARIILQSVYVLYSIYTLQDRTYFLTQLLLNYFQSSQGLFNNYLMRHSCSPNWSMTGTLRHSVALAGHYAGQRFTLWAKKKTASLFSLEKFDPFNTKRDEDRSCLTP